MSAVLNVAISGALAAAFFNPVTGVVTFPLSLICLAFALYQGEKGVVLGLECLARIQERRAIGNEIDSVFKDIEELEAAFDDRGDAFQQAVGSIEVRIHPQLVALQNAICAKVGVEYELPSPEVVSDGFPALEPYFDHPFFRKEMPSRYRNLLAEL